MKKKMKREGWDDIACASVLFRYLRNLTTGRIVLWCYAIWYLVVLVRYFDPNPLLWLSSIGLSAIIGVALLLSTRTTANAGQRIDPWVIFRLFLMPFCVSSFAALIKGHGFILVFPPRLSENAIAVGLCAVFVVGVFFLKQSKSTSTMDAGELPREECLKQE